MLVNNGIYHVWKNGEELVHTNSQSVIKLSHNDQNDLSIPVILSDNFEPQQSHVRPANLKHHHTILCRRSQSLLGNSLHFFWLQLWWSMVMTLISSIVGTPLGNGHVNDDHSCEYTGLPILHDCSITLPPLCLYISQNIGLVIYHMFIFLMICIPIDLMVWSAHKAPT